MALSKAQIEARKLAILQAASQLVLARPVQMQGDRVAAKALADAVSDARAMLAEIDKSETGDTV